MKVITLLTGGNIGGIETLCRDYALYSRHDNVMVTLWGEGPLVDEMNKLGIRVINLHASRRNVPATIHKVMRLVREEKADVLIAQHEASMSHLCLMRAKALFPDIRTIAYAQLNAVDMIRAHEKKGLFIRKKILGTSLGKADAVVAISESVKRSLMDVFGLKGSDINIIYNGTDLKRFPLVERNFADGEDLKLVYVGRLIEEKGVQITIKALKELKGKTGFRFKIIGDGEYREHLEQLAGEYGLGEYIEFCGSRRDVPELLGQADVFIHMPVWAEGFGIAVAEAMSAGCICICADNGAMPELIDDGINGFIVEKENAEALSRTILKVAGMTQGEKQAMSEEAHKKAEKFSIDVFVKDLDDLADRLHAQ